MSYFVLFKIVSVILDLVIPREFLNKLVSFYLACQFLLVAQLVKNPPAMLETWVRSLGWKDPLETGTATHCSILAWRIPWSIVHGVTKSWM